MLAVNTASRGLENLRAIAEWHVKRGCPPPNVRVERNPSHDGYLYDFYVASGEPNAWLASEPYRDWRDTEVIDVVLVGPDEVVGMVQSGQISVADIMTMSTTACAG